MGTPEIIMVVSVALLAIAGVIFVIRFFFRNAGCLFALFAFALACVALAVDGNSSRYWIGAGVCLLLCLVASAKRKGTKKIGEKKDKPSVTYKTIDAFAAAIESGEAKIDANIKAIFGDLAGRLQSLADEIGGGDISDMIDAEVKVVNRIAEANVRGDKRPRINDLDELLELVENRQVKLDQSTKTALRDVYDFVESLEIDDDDAMDSAADITCTLEQILYPNGMTEKQAEDASNRLAKRKGGIRRSQTPLSRTPPRPPRR